MKKVNFRLDNRIYRANITKSYFSEFSPMTTENAAIPDESPALISDPEEEAGWLRAVANGDRTAFRKLHERFERILYSTIAKVLNHHEDTEDVLQEVFAMIWGKANLYDVSKGKPLTWANTMARNRAIDRYRSKQRRSALGDRYGDHVTVTTDKASVETEAEVELHETSKILRAAVYELTPVQRESIELAYFGGFTQREVAEKVGQDVGTVKARIRRGIKRMEKQVRAEFS